MNNRHGSATTPASGVLVEVIPAGSLECARRRKPYPDDMDEHIARRLHTATY